MIIAFILLPENFLQIDWLRGEIFQLNLKYIHVKITVSMVAETTSNSLLKNYQNSTEMNKIHSLL